MKLAICVATMRTPGNYYPGEIPSWTTNAISDFIPVSTRYNKEDDNLGVVGSYSYLTQHTESELLAFIHDDVICREKGWDTRVLKEFENETVGVVGFGGALRHGREDIYKTPYVYSQLQRYGYRSNVDDAEIHGIRDSGSCDVAVLDGFALVCKRDFLDRSGGFGWLSGRCDFFNYDYAICAMAHRFGYRVRFVGVHCQHLGGRSSTSKGAQKIVNQEAYDKAHRWFYDEFRDTIPWSCE